MPESFGARLRQQRERQQIVLTTIADQTKIKVSLLEGLERDDISHWPAGIFRRAFIRAYAHAIGLEPDVVVREFLVLHPDPIDDAATPSALRPGVDDGPVSGAPPTRLRYLVGSAIGSLSRGQSAVVQKRGSEFDDPPAACLPASAAPAPEVGDPSAACPPVAAPAPVEPDLSAAADLCTELGRIEKARDVTSLLQEAAKILDAVGLIVWVWDSHASELRPSLAYGYSDTVLAQLPTVRRDAENATAAAFRSAQACIVDGSDNTSGALVVPLIAPAGCVGVLAIEVQHGRERTGWVRALMTIFAAQLARGIGAERPATEFADRRPA